MAHGCGTAVHLSNPASPEMWFSHTEKNGFCNATSDEPKVFDVSPCRSMQTYARRSEFSQYDVRSGWWVAEMRCIARQCTAWQRAKNLRLSQSGSSNSQQFSQVSPKVMNSKEILLLSGRFALNRGSTEGV